MDDNHDSNITYSTNLEVNGVPGRLVRVCCPGVHHQDIEVLGRYGFGFGL